MNSPRPNPPSPMPPAPPMHIAPSLHEPGALEFATDRLPWQRSLRWDKTPPGWRRVLSGLLLALLLTVLELVGLALVMRPYGIRSPVVSRPVEVVRIDIETDLPIPPEPVPPPIPPRPLKIPIETPQVHTTRPPPRPVESNSAMQATIEPAQTPTAQPLLFNPDGSIRVGSAAAQRSSSPKNPREAAKARWAEIEHRGNPADCHKTRFAQAYVPDQSLGAKVASKYLKWIGLADMQAIAHDREQRDYSGGCDPAPSVPSR